MVQSVIQRLKKFIQFKWKSYTKSTRMNTGTSNEVSVPSPSPHPSTSLTKAQRNILRQYDGKLLLRQEIHFNEAQFQHLLKQQYFTRYESFTHSLLATRCVRCNNHQRSLLGRFPCATCGTTHLYCRNCIMMGRVSTCEKLYAWTGPSYQWEMINDACSWDGSLTFAQAKAARKVKEAVRNEKELLVWAVTGAGKTEILFKGIELALAQGKRVCIASPRADVVRELLPRIQAAFKGVTVQGLYGSSRDREGTAQLIIATTHQLIRFYNAFDVLIIDEIDAFPYHYDETLQYATNRAVKERSTKIYLTATPRKKLKQQLKLKQLPYCFVPIRYHGHPLPVPTFMSDYTLTKKLTNKALPKKLIPWLIRRKRPDRQLLIFVPTIELADELYEAVVDCLLSHQLISDEHSVASVHAEDPLREEKVEQFRKKTLYALITTTILERGVTFPSIDVVVLQANHQVFDEAALVQIAGRAGRNQKDPTGEVLFIHDGKTEAMEQSRLSIKEMNRRGQQLLSNRKR